ncbi:MAG TPA: hypothetical protein VJ553_06425, partial [Candidatus Paceibacterota bacterium]|nr:hypothetical protein [Candidatus Paceibacterota bacterium]
MDLRELQRRGKVSNGKGVNPMVIGVAGGNADPPAISIPVYSSDEQSDSSDERQTSTPVTLQPIESFVV